MSAEVPAPIVVARDPGAAEVLARFSAQPLMQRLMDEHDAHIRATLAEQIAKDIEALREITEPERSWVRQRPAYAIARAAKVAREAGAS